MGMFSANDYLITENKKARDSYFQTLDILNGILHETRYTRENPYFSFCHHIALLLLDAATYFSKAQGEYFHTADRITLSSDNQKLFHELTPDAYSESYANPSYCAQVFGLEAGQLLSYYYMRLRKNYEYAFSNKLYKMEENQTHFIEFYNLLSDGIPDVVQLKTHVLKPEYRENSADQSIMLAERYDSRYRHFLDIIENSDLTTTNYLYRYGIAITENELRMSAYLAAYPEERINQLAKMVVDSYINGFYINHKDPKTKSSATVWYNAGQERIIRAVFAELRENGLEPTVFACATTEINRQVDYDHRFDNALYLNEAWADTRNQSFEKACLNCQDLLSKFSGIIYFDKFGETPFNPQNKLECLKLTPKQTEIFQDYQNRRIAIDNRYRPVKERSFTIVAFPTPEIGEHFEAIFEETLSLNMLESHLYERIQQTLIDTLDRADFVRVKGKDANRTDILVKMPPLTDPLNQTLFFNCGADVNIPVGEVFTSPQLQGTSGVLHIEEVFLNELRYDNLFLTFQDGYISDYSCKNFEDEAENRKYIEENLLFPHKTLPIGEFAIGTNTLAYTMSRNYDIVNILPILIVEKMGPHFAIGDTCFSREEDVAVYNPNGKEIIARDNEKSILRKDNPSEAYTNTHIDITLPYDAIEVIQTLERDGATTDIIRNGRFVLDGTEKLNEAFL